MFRPLIVLLAVGIVLGVGAPSSALKLVSPTANQTVRESVRIAIPLAELPPDFVMAEGETAPEKGRPFLTLSVGSGDAERLVAAVSPDVGTVKNGAVTFYWDSKAPYKDPQDPRNDRFYKDGKYTLTVQVYDALGKAADSASVDVVLKNKVARPNPAPAVRLVNRLVFGESHTYRCHADVQVFHVVAGTGLPVLGGMGMTSDFSIIQSVEDKRPDGSYLMRCKMHDEGFIQSFGRKLRLFAVDQPRPQLYRLVDKYGNVINRNVFSRQAKYTIMDVLPVLDQRPVREGDSWPTAFDLKIEGITGVIPMTGDSQLDSFEWQDGHECAKIISNLKGTSAISMDNGRIRSSSPQVDAKVLTYFAYQSGKMLRREITLDFPALIMPGAGQIEGAAPTDTTGLTPPGVAPSPMPYSAEPMAGEDVATEGTPGRMPRPYLGTPSTPNTLTNEPVAKKGSVQIKAVVRLEK